METGYISVVGFEFGAKRWWLVARLWEKGEQIMMRELFLSFCQILLNQIS